MSSGYSGPYQSRLLNFISRQSRQIVDKCDRTWREVQLASLGATQILLYPVYLLVQSTRMLGRQLRESTKKVDLPELQEFVTDKNPNLSENLSENEIEASSAIGEILQVAENLLLPSQISKVSESCSFTIKPPKPTVKAAADRKLQEIPQQFSSTIAKAQKFTTVDMPAAQSWEKDDSLALFKNASGLVVETDSNTAAEIANKPQVRGIASFIAARTLVLVGGENQILDILTPEQQQLLEGRIIWEVAHDGPGRREIAEKELKFNLGLESAAQKTKIKPVRAFWQLMAWVQSSPVAVKRNQFGESIFAVKKAIDASVNGNLILAEKAVRQLARSNAELQATAAANFTAKNPPELTASFNGKFDRTPNTLSFVTLVDRAAVNLEQFSLPPVSKITTAFTETGAAKTLDTSAPNPNLSFSAREILENYARNIEQLIWSSVDNLLGKETAASDNTEKSVAIKYYLQQQAQNNTENAGNDRPWLKWQDLFGEPSPAPTVGAVPSGAVAISQSSTKVKEEIKELEILPEGRSADTRTSAYPEAIQALVAQLKRSLLTKVEKSQPQKDSNLTKPQINNFTVPASETKLNFSPTAITVETSRYAATTAETRTPENQNARSQHQDDYLETKAVSVGYIKHPLEQVLEWLDGIMLRLETIAIELWKWAKINLPKILNSKDKIH